MFEVRHKDYYTASRAGFPYEMHRAAECSVGLQEHGAEEWFAWQTPGNSSFIGSKLTPLSQKCYIF